MKNRRSQYPRWLYIHQQISSKKFPNCSIMAKEYEVSSKTIQRDIELLKNQMNFPIAFDSVKNGYYYTEKNFAFPLMELKESDFFYFFLMEKALAQFQNTPIYAKLNAMFEKLKMAMNESMVVKTSWIHQQFVFCKDNLSIIADEVWDKVSESLEKKLTLKILYQRPKADNPEERAIQPYFLIYKEGEVFSLAYCLKRKAMRSFALSRMLNVTITGHVFEIPESFQLEKYKLDYYPALPNDPIYSFRIWFEPEAKRYIQERSGFPEQKIIENQDGSIILEFPHPDLNEIKKWLYGWGKSATVFEPPELVEIIRSELKDWLRRYSF